MRLCHSPGKGDGGEHRSGWCGTPPRVHCTEKFDHGGRIGPCGAGSIVASTGFAEVLQHDDVIEQPRAGGRECEQRHCNFWDFPVRSKSAAAPFQPL